MARSGRKAAARSTLLVCALALLVGVLVPGVFPGSARADGEIAVGLAGPDDSSFPEVSFVVTADRGGRPLSQLGIENVLVTEGGQAATVTSVRRAQDSGIPLAVIVTIDTSGSMQGASMEQARAAAGALVQRLTTNDVGAVVAFGDQARVVEPLTRDRGSLQRAIAALQPAGNTALYDAVGESARLATESGNVRRAIVLLSDGREFGGASTLSREQALERVALSGAVFYMVGVGEDLDRALLEEIAARSGGRYFEASGASEVPQIYAALEELLRGQFLVTARSPASPYGASRQLRVEVREGGGQGMAERAYTSKRPSSATTEPTSAPTAVASTATVVTAAAPAPAVEEPDSGLPLLPLAGGTVVVLAIAAFFWRQRGRPVSNDVTPVPLVRTTNAEFGPAAGVLRVTSGPMAGTRFALAQVPATIGSGEQCAVRLAAGEGIAVEHARLWWRDGKPMLHHLAAGYETRVNGRTIDWASLDVGYEVAIGPLLLRFEAPALAAEIDEERPRALRPGA